MEGPNLQAGLTCNRQVPGVEHVSRCRADEACLPFPKGTLNRFAWGRTVVRRRPSQPTRRGLAHKQDLYRLPKEATHPRGEHPDPGSTCSPTQRHWQASASTSAARAPYGTRATIPNHHRGTKCHGDPSAASPEGNASFHDRRPPPRGDGRWRHASHEASHLGSCCSPLPVRSLPVPHRLLSTAARPPIPRITPDGRGEFPLQSPPPERLRPR